MFDLLLIRKEGVFMFKQKKTKRNLDSIGKVQYGFNLEYEKGIYLHACTYHMTKKQKEALEEKHKFNTHQEWREYIRNKYAYMGKVGLERFSRYLNQKARTVELNNSYFVLCISAALSVLLAELLKFLFVENLPVEYDGSWQSWLKILGYTLLCVGSVFFAVGVVFKRTADETYNYGVEKNLIIDYKEVIDEMIVSLEEKEQITVTEENCILIDSDRMELKNIKADVNIETAHVSISIKQKD